MANLPGETVSYTATDSGHPQLASFLKRDSPAPATLELKVGAAVLLLKNINDELVNGSQGVVVAFTDEAGYYRQYVDGQGDVESTDRRSREEQTRGGDGGPCLDGKHFPVVRFVLRDGGHQLLHCKPAPFTVELKIGSKMETATRRQVPLILAWALSIHKSQGQNLDYVRVDMAGMWEAGQGYVALSRARRMDGLQVVNFTRASIKADSTVQAFYNGLRDNKGPQTRTGSILRFLQPAGL